MFAGGLLQDRSEAGNTTFPVPFFLTVSEHRYNCEVNIEHFSVFGLFLRYAQAIKTFFFFPPVDSPEKKKKKSDIEMF